MMRASRSNKLSSAAGVVVWRLSGDAKALRGRVMSRGQPSYRGLAASAVSHAQRKHISTAALPFDSTSVR